MWNAQYNHLYTQGVAESVGQEAEPKEQEEKVDSSVNGENVLFQCLRNSCSFWAITFLHMPNSQ